MEFHKENPPSVLSKYDIEFFKQNAAGANPHFHSAIEFLYVSEGKIKIDIDSSVFYASKGDIVLMRSNTVHSVCGISDINSYYVLKITVQLLFDIFKGCDSPECIIAFLRYKKGDKSVFKAEEISKELNNILDKMINEYNFGSDIIISIEKAYACLFVITIFRDYFSSLKLKNDINICSDMIALIYDSVEYINLNYASDITAAECAKRINLSYSYYAKLFRAIVGKGFKEYLTSTRMSKAYNTLISTDYTVTDIALSCGYKSPAHFAAEYKKYYNCTPRETRKSGIAKSEI